MFILFLFLNINLLLVNLKDHKKKKHISGSRTRLENDAVGLKSLGEGEGGGAKWRRLFCGCFMLASSLS